MRARDLIIPSTAARLPRLEEGGAAVEESNERTDDNGHARPQNPGRRLLSAALKIGWRDDRMAKPAVARFEITGKDSARLRRFYSELFDWEIAEGAEGSGFGVVAAGAGGISGVIGPDRIGGQGHGTVYVEVDDPAAYLAKAEGLGGKTVGAPRDVPEFRLTFAFFEDPEGHLVGLSRGVLRAKNDA
jgi:predicted enzyme related to lactoylglutathione lyase